MSAIWDALDNASLAAFIGAAAAYFLVVATDWRRNRRTAKVVLPALLGRLQSLVRTRDEGVIAALQSLGGRGPWLRNIGLRFPVERIERLTEAVADRLSDRQASALDNLGFYMRAADRLNAESLHLLDGLEDAAAVPPMKVEELMARNALPMQLKKRYGEERILLAQIGRTIDAYVSDLLNDTGGPLEDPRDDSPPSSVEGSDE